jgi:ketosteroid isomerase-like protein
MGTAENKQLLQHLFAEASRGNVEPFLGRLAEGVRWTVTGTTKFSRTFAGKPAVLHELLGPITSQALT